MARREAAPRESPIGEVIVTCTLHWPFPVRSTRWLGPIGVNVLGNRYRYFEEATAGEWRQAERAARQSATGLDQRYVEQLTQMVKIADAMNIADDVVLWPRLVGLAKAGKVTVTVK